ncbi:M48 family metallopeptidase [Methylovorus sp. MP688]|uniref:M48 family metallopeptidase n=1 Tax=Methylovorus sp. (strain MP688) TaxID=887061 RepID=UPI0001EC47D0|nr:M48 family metallopeptidase [Methylovorus sp. MP688]ADQ84889.1 peptidase M48 [Methylovorus sp. MP688]
MKKTAWACLFASLFSLPPQAMAFDLGGALKDAVEKNAGDLINNKNSNDADTTPANPEANSLASINWKSPSRDEEIKLGREIAGNLLGAAPLVKNPSLQQYVNRVGRWVASQSERSDLPWHFGVIDSDDINAFAAPGGYVLITKGLYKRLQNEAQLAGVLGHEIAHIVQKHQLKVLQKQQLLSVGAGLLSGKVAKGNQTIEKVIGSGAEISARSLDKDAEYEADRMGLILAARAGYDPYGLPEVLSGLEDISSNDGSIALLFKTHPAPEERLAALGAATAKSGNLPTGKTLEKRLLPLP